jgi:hypothetical protein
MASSIEGALNISDVYVTLSQLKDLVSSDVDRKIHDAISKLPT